MVSHSAVARSLSRSVSLCRARWLRTLSPNIKKGRWNAEEDKVSVWNIEGGMFRILQSVWVSF